MSKTIYAANHVCAVIVTYNGEATIKETIDALRHQVGHLLIVDNNSNDHTKDILRNIKKDNLSVIFNDENRGIGFALNQGVDFARGNGYGWLITMDQDSVADAGMIRELLNGAEIYTDDSRVVSFSPRITQKKMILTKNVPDFEKRYTVITSGNLVRLSVFDHVGKFNDALFIDSVDFDFCLRLRSKGYKIVRNNRAVLYHSLGHVENVYLLGWYFVITAHSPLRKYYMLRNHIYITNKYFTKFPLFCLRKQVGMLRIILQTLLLERHKKDNLLYLLKGISHGFINKRGPLQLHGQ